MQRSRLEIMARITQECLVPRHKTHIMYRSNLTFAQANSYLDLLILQKLLSHEDSTYQTTDKRLQFLYAYNQLSKIIGMPSFTSNGNAGLLKILTSSKTSKHAV